MSFGAKSENRKAYILIGFQGSGFTIAVSGLRVAGPGAAGLRFGLAGV